ERPSRGAVVGRLHESRHDEDDPERDHHRRNEKQQPEEQADGTRGAGLRKHHKTNSPFAWDIRVRLARVARWRGEARGMKNEAVIGGITVGGQPSPEELMSGRFGHVVNIRGAEEAGNVTGEVLAGSDVAYTSVPWTIDTVTNEDIDRMREAISASEGPVLIH
ncbi:MAG: putative phosphatase, partial [Candidatus Eremiobacteraeota bacterium]|nr:putative phosphatase [Candidatus Eremiobacteraeota bacterium]